MNKKLYEETNALVEERFALMQERVAQIAENPEVPETFADYFKTTAAFLNRLAALAEEEKNGTIADKSLAELEEVNAALYVDVMPQAYEKSYANPTYAHNMLVSGEGEADFAAALSLLYARIRDQIREVYRGNLQHLTVVMELS